jgi:hypothetical protein
MKLLNMAMAKVAELAVVVDSVVVVVDLVLVDKPLIEMFQQIHDI